MQSSGFRTRRIGSSSTPIGYSIHLFGADAPSVPCADNRYGAFRVPAISSADRRRREVTHPLNHAQHLRKHYFVRGYRRSMSVDEITGTLNASLLFVSWPKNVWQMYIKMDFICWRVMFKAEKNHTMPQRNFLSVHFIRFVIGLHFEKAYMSDVY